MIPLARVPVWTNWRRRRFLRRFREELDAYFAEVRYEAFPFRVVESDRAVELRRELEGDLQRCRRVVQAADTVSPLRLAPGEEAGEVIRVNVIAEAFRLHRHNLRKQDLIDVLDATEAAYRADRMGAWGRTLNPLYWVDMGLGFVEVVPFLPLGLARMNWRRAARSRGGRVVRVILRAGILVVLVLAVVRLAGLQDAALDAFARAYDVARRLPARLLGS